MTDSCHSFGAINAPLRQGVTLDHGGEQVPRRQPGIASIQSSLALCEIKASSRLAIPRPLPR